ncbi:MAG: helix-turn-helix domain-containing protein, partial [Treponema sp.]|nr:helix-turn-helix domain-containing protein [Treponema sp.]
METCNIKEAGAILGCCRHHVLKLIRTGKIPASIVGRS